MRRPARQRTGCAKATDEFIGVVEAVAAKAPASAGATLDFNDGINAGTDGAFRSAGVEFVRVWTAEVFAIEDYPDMMKKLTALLEANAEAD